MKHAALLLALAAATTSAAAKDKLIPLSDSDAAVLRDKSIALTVHEKPSFVAFTAGKATFGLFGAGAMVKAGNDFVRDNGIADPAEIVRGNLAAELADVYGAKFLAADGTPTKAEKAKDLAALHADADYVLDVRTVGWSYIYYPTDWSHYWLGYTVQVQLIDAKSGRQVANAACGAGSKDHKNPPTHDQLYANGARLTKDLLASAGWTCTNLLAKDLFHMPAEHLLATPAQYVDPLAAIAPTATAATAESAAPTTATDAAAAADTNAATDATTAPQASPSSATMDPAPNATAPTNPDASNDNGTP